MNHQMSNKNHVLYNATINFYLVYLSKLLSGNWEGKKKIVFHLGRCFITPILLRKKNLEIWSVDQRDLMPLLPCIHAFPF